MFDFNKNLRNKELFIQKRRLKDNSTSSLLQHISKGSLLRESALFSQKATKINKNRDFASLKSDSESLKTSQLLARKNRLKELISNEFEEYKLEIAKVEKDPELKKAGLLERIEKMRVSKENRRKEFVNMQMERVFEKNNWDFREIKRDREKIETLKGIQGQICEKQGELLREYEENMIYEELRKRGSENEKRLATKKAEDHAKKVGKNAEIIKLQMKMRENDTGLEKDLDLRRNEELKTVFRLEKEQEKDWKISRIGDLRDKMKRVFEENIEQEKEKNLRIVKEKEEDKAWLNEILRKERETLENESIIKMENDKKKKNFLMNFKPKNDAEEKEIERLVNEQNERIWKEQQENWRKNEEKRLKLLYATYESRTKALKDKKAGKIEEIQEKVKEREKVDNETIKGFEREEIERKDVFYREKTNKGHILAQSMEKEQLLQRKKELEDMENRLLKGIQEDIEGKLENERKKNRDLMSDLRRSYPF